MNSSLKGFYKCVVVNSIGTSYKLFNVIHQAKGSYLMFLLPEIYYKRTNLLLILKILHSNSSYYQFKDRNCWKKQKCED